MGLSGRTGYLYIPVGSLQVYIHPWNARLRFIRGKCSIVGTSDAEPLAETLLADKTRTSGASVLHEDIVDLGILSAAGHHAGINL